MAVYLPEDGSHLKVVYLVAVVVYVLDHFVYFLELGCYFVESSLFSLELSGFMFFAFLLCLHILYQNIVFFHFLLDISLDGVLYSFPTYFLDFIQQFILGFNCFQIHQIGSSPQLHFFVVVLGEGLPYELVFVVLHEGVVLSLGGEASVEIFFNFKQVVVLTFLVILLPLWLNWHIFCDFLVGLLIFL